MVAHPLPEDNFFMKNQVSPVVSAVSKLDFSGHVIPHSWRNHIKLDSGLPDLVGMYILADIVYWYRPTDITDENDRVIGKQDKFWGDKLQRSYDQISEMLGVSYKQARTAITRLCKLGVLRKEIRSVKTKEGVMPKVMYLEPIPEGLAAITYYDKIASAPQGTPSALQGRSSAPEGTLHLISSESTTENKIIGGSANASPNIGFIDSSITESVPPTRPTKNKDVAKATDTPSQHPVIQVLRNTLGRYPAKEKMLAIIEAVGDNPNLELLGSVAKQWLLRGYNTTNYDSLIRAYKEGGLTPQGKQIGFAPKTTITPAAPVATTDGFNQAYYDSLHPALKYRYLVSKGMVIDSYGNPRAK